MNFRGHYQLTLIVSLLGAGFARAGEFTVTTDALVYEPGQPIEVTITNDTDERAIMFCELPYLISSVDTGEVAGPCDCLTWIIEIPAGEARTDTVYQVDCGTGEPLPWTAGMYELELPYMLGVGGEEAVATTVLCVGPGCAATGAAESGVAARTWGRVKTSYRP